MQHQLAGFCVPMWTSFSSFFIWEIQRDFFHISFSFNRLAALQFIREVYWDYEYEEVVTPNIYNFDLWKTSGHADHYKQNMFSFDIEKQEFGLKPMNCPGNGFFRESVCLPVATGKHALLLCHRPASVICPALPCPALCPALPCPALRPVLASPDLPCPLALCMVLHKTIINQRIHRFSILLILHYRDSDWHWPCSLPTAMSAMQPVYSHERQAAFQQL